MRLPYWRLSTFYFFYFAALGSFLPFWPVYLSDQGCSAAQIGQLMAVLAGTKIFAPNVWGWLADRASSRMRVIRWACALSALSFVGAFYSHGFAWMAAVLLLYGFFWNASLPSFEAVTVNFLGGHAHRYGLIRLWGSVGFIFGVLAAGFCVDRFGSAVLPQLHLWLLGLIWLSGLWTPDQPGAWVQPETDPSFRTLLRHRRVGVFLWMFFLVQMAHGPYYAFFTLHLNAFGYTGEQSGWLWTLGVVAEIALFVVLGRAGRGGGGQRLLLWALGLGAGRWLLIAQHADSLPMLLFAQVLHAATFGVTHLAVVNLVRECFGARHQAKGQALFNSVGYGLGGLVGSLGSGWAWQRWGSDVVFGASSVLFVLAFLSILLANARVRAVRR